MKILSMPKGADHKDVFKDGALEMGMAAYAYKANGIGSTGSAGGSLSIVGTNLRLMKSGYAGDTSWITDEIDFTNVNSITLTVANFSSFTMYAGVTQSGLVDNYTMLSKVDIPTTGIYTIDTSSITGLGRLAICLYVNNTNTHYADFSSIIVNN